MARRHNPPVPTCPKCSSPVPEDASFCPSCAAPTGISQAVTETAPPESKPVSPPTATSTSFGGGRFAAGTQLGTRYRIVGLLGQGGMGEVYRADDLELGQSVALKFLPPDFAAKPGAIERFKSEVRTARQIAHPNVCKMYDIGEIDGHIFLSMEYIDGEDLAAVIRRLGRPSKEKSLEIARQLCLGLAAAHETGILHRDLKPANVMIDGRGRVRITDFGLAGLIDELAAQNEKVGTPAYMAPEQLSGGTVSIRSDIYALGLVLYELYSGKRAFEAANAADVRSFHQSGTVTTPSSLSTEIDPAVERVIMRCLEKEPQARPASVYAVLGALPGGDPLAAALAAGETPSPELLAEAGSSGGLKPPIAIALLIATIVLGGVAIGWDARDTIAARVQPSVPHDELVFRARKLLEQVGVGEPPQYRYDGFETAQHYLQHLKKAGDGKDTFAALADGFPPVLHFWFRASPERLEPIGLHTDTVFSQNPPLTDHGEVHVELAADGRLTCFRWVPPETWEPAEPQAAPDFSTLFEYAQIDPTSLEPATPRLRAPVPVDQLTTERGIGPGGTEFLVMTGSFRGQPTYFEIAWPWDLDPQRQEGWKDPPVLFIIFVLTVLGGVGVLARRNLRTGRGDRKGAFRVGLFVTTVMLLSWVVGNAPTLDARSLAAGLLWGVPLGHALQHAVIVWILYIALEPYARRFFPQCLISWSRILAGRFRDARVGRDILIGATAAMAMQIVFLVAELLDSVSPHDQPQAFPPFVGIRMAFAGILRGAENAIGPSFLFLAALVLARIVTRRNWAAIALSAGVIMLVIVGSFFADVEETRAFVIGVVVLALVTATQLTILIRFGVVAALSWEIVTRAAQKTSSTFQPGTWYFSESYVPLGFALVLVGFGFYNALAGRSLLRDELHGSV